MYTNDKNNDSQYCVITEQGDLGLGANVLNGEDQKMLNEQQQMDQKNKK